MQVLKPDAPEFCKDSESHACALGELEAGLPEWLRDWAGELRAIASRGPVFLSLEGEMGAGKTTWVRALLRALEVTEGFKGSPTYPIEHRYQGSGLRVYHLDLYRIRSVEELEERGFSELDLKAGAIYVVEWASLFEDWAHAVSKRMCRGRIRITIPDEGASDAPSSEYAHGRIYAADRLTLSE